MNDLNDVLNLSQIGSLLSYFSSSNFNEHSIFNDYIKMIHILSSQDLENIQIFFNENNRIIEFINFFFQKEVYPIYYLFNNPYLTIDSIKYLLSLGAKLSFENEEKSILESLLNNTGISDSKVLEILRFLKDHNFDFTKKNKYGCNIHYYLASCIHLNNEIFDLFKGKEYDKNVSPMPFNEAPLLIATRMNNNFYANLLLDCDDCNVNIQNNNKNTSLMYACMNNNYNLINRLIGRGADPNIKDNQGDVAFFYACGCDTKQDIDIDLVKHLHNLGFDIHQKSEDNFTALHYASGCYKNIFDIEVVKYLIEIGLDPESIDKKGKTFLDYLINYYDPKVIFKEIIQNINLGINLKNSIILNNLDFNICELILCKDKVKCSISHCEIESGETFYKCSFDHCFDKDLLIKWYRECDKYQCPLCLNPIDLTKIYVKE